MYLTERTRSFHHLFVDGLSLRATLILPVADGAFIQREGGDNGLHWTAMRQQGDDTRNQLGFFLSPIKDRAFGRTERLVADVTNVAAFFL
ncbi:MAG: hypothetical protein ACREEM_49145 [Blastocatellia bacterium]